MISGAIIGALALASFGASAQDADSPWSDYPTSIPEAVFQWNAKGGSVFWIKEGEMDAPPNSVRISFWLRGDHSRDSGVSFRTSLQKVSLFCSGTYSVSALTTRTPDGKIEVSKDYRFPESKQVRPDTMFWDIMKEYCPG